VDRGENREMNPFTCEELEAGAAGKSSRQGRGRKAEDEARQQYRTKTVNSE